MSETWTDEKGWKRVKEKLPQGFKWGVQCAKRKSKKGRATGGMLMGIRKELLEEGSEIENEREGMIVGMIRIAKERWRIIGVYVGEGIERALQGMEKWIEEKEEGVRAIIGDFNARTGREGRGVYGRGGRGEEFEKIKR